MHTHIHTHLSETGSFDAALDEPGEVFVLVVLEGTHHDGRADVLGGVDDLQDARNSLWRCGVMWCHVAVWCDVVVWYGVMWWCGVMWCDVVVWYGVMWWCGMV